MITNSDQKDFNTSLRAYITGFGLCIIVTLASFATVMFLDVSSTSKIVAITLLAAIQVALQTYYFLHIGQKRTPKWNTASYLFTIMSVALIVLGSLWVMANLNYNMMHDPSSDEQEIIEDEGIKTEEHSH
jgi:cytochrome o ubiquinol oxidase subunit IV